MSFGNVYLELINRFWMFKSFQNICLRSGEGPHHFPGCALADLWGMESQEDCMSDLSKPDWKVCFLCTEDIFPVISRLQAWQCAYAWKIFNAQYILSSLVSKEIDLNFYCSLF